MKKIIFLSILSSLTLVGLSQNVFKNKDSVKNTTKDNYKISGEIIGLQDSSVMLAYYFGGKQFARDTAFSINGKFSLD